MPEKAEKYGWISGSAVKYIAIFAMLLDHIAHIFLTPETAPYIAMRCLGRMTAPIMCFFIAEGYHYTKDLTKYFVRLAVFAVISHFAFSFAFRGKLLSIMGTSVIATLLLSLTAVWVVNCKGIEKAYKLPIHLVILAAAQWCDWGYKAVIFTLCFELGRGSRLHQIAGYACTALCIEVIPRVSEVIGTPAFAATLIIETGVLLAIPLLLMYNGKKGGGKYTKWVFYVFYPAHLIVLGLIKRGIL